MMLAVVAFARICGDDDTVNNKFSLSILFHRLFLSFGLNLAFPDANRRNQSPLGRANKGTASAFDAVERVQFVAVLPAPVLSVIRQQKQLFAKIRLFGERIKKIILILKEAAV